VKKVFIMASLMILCISGISAFAQENKVAVIPLLTTQKAAKSGQTFAGQLDAFVSDDAGDNWTLAGASYALPLPAGTSSPIVEYLNLFDDPNSTTTTCPGIGQATPGRLCIYIYQEINFSYIAESAQSSGVNRLYGFSVDVHFDPSVGTTSRGYLLSSWAYKVP
jgi:hypothetical protein